MMPPPDIRRHYIEVAAYFRAEKRGFLPGHEEEDWAEAEREVEALWGSRLSG